MSLEEKLVLCKDCVNEHKNNKGNILYSYKGYYTILKTPESMLCTKCGCELTETNISKKDFVSLCRISQDINFLDSMIKLAETDPVEYQLKLSQFKAQLAQQESAKQDSKPHCPHCKSTNIKPISGLNRGASIAMWGIFSKKINKSFECLNCKYTW